MRRTPGHVGAGERDAAGGRAVQPHQAAQQRGLARAVAADQGGDLPLLDLQRHVVEDLRVAVPGAQAVEAKQRTLPGRR